MFDLEKEINLWLSQLRKDSSFEDGDIAELEDHIRDGIEFKFESRLSAEEAFIETKKSF